ncbi:MAG: EamA family transporter [Candidatus Nanosyncoccaceae bacterium]|jgi:uncharacterized membrane protein
MNLLMVGLRMLATLLYATTNHIDRFLVTKTYKEPSTKALMVFSTVVAGIVTLPITLVLTKFTIDFNWLAFILVFLSAVSFMVSTYLYFLALEFSNTTLTVAMLQLIPVFNFFISLIFFGQTIKPIQIIGALIIITAAVVMTTDFKKLKREKTSWRFLLLMTFSSLMYAVYHQLFVSSIDCSNYGTAANLYQVALLIIGLFLWFRRSYREQFIDVIKANGRLFLGINVLNELLNSAAGLLVNYVAIFLPLAIVNTLNGFQPAFVLILGLIGAKFWPKIFDDKLSRREAVKSAICIAVILVGLYIMLS